MWFNDDSMKRKSVVVDWAEKPQFRVAGHLQSTAQGTPPPLAHIDPFIDVPSLHPYAAGMKRE